MSNRIGLETQRTDDTSQIKDDTWHSAEFNESIDLSPRPVDTNTLTFPLDQLEGKNNLLAIQYKHSDNRGLAIKTNLGSTDLLDQEQQLKFLADIAGIDNVDELSDISEDQLELFKIESQILRDESPGPKTRADIAT